VEGVLRGDLKVEDYKVPTKQKFGSQVENRSHKISEN
jgi:hypothetical protein